MKSTSPPTKRMFSPRLLAAYFLLLAAATLTAFPAAAQSENSPQPPADSKPAETAPNPARLELEQLTLENKLAAEHLTQETNSLRAEITRLKIEREKILETAALEDAKHKADLRPLIEKSEAERDQLTRDGELARIRAEKLSNELKALQASAALEITRLQNEITRIETTEKRGEYADAKPQYLKKPLLPNGTLVISDRRVPLNGPITQQTADHITNRIQYWNNKDRELPIFIVIDTCPGGSVMAGYRILKAMESSEAPVHVVVKSLAASMAAAITTLAKESYAYPNAVILHHQISSQIIGQLNLTQQREFHEESQRWWVRLSTPIATKMGITPDELIHRMYERSSSGDWSEFAEQAVQLKWVNHLVQGIDETSFTKNPDVEEPSGTTPPKQAFREETDSTGNPFMRLPRLDAKDVYFLYNPDGYYRLR